MINGNEFEINKGNISLEMFQNPTITDTIAVSEQPHVTSSLSVFENANPTESCFEKRIRLVQFLGELVEFQLKLNKST